MAITIGNTNITGLSAGGLPNGIVTADDLATGISNAKLGPGLVINDAFGLYTGNGTAINSTTYTDVTSFTYTPLSSDSMIYVWYHFNTWWAGTSGNSGDLFMRMQVEGGSYSSRTQFFENPRVIGNFSDTGSRYLHSHGSAVGRFQNNDTTTKTIHLQCRLTTTQPSSIFVGSDSGGTRSYYIEEVQQ